ncbi:MAG TPA: hypothetical protein VEL28_17160 [Candidatus Binatia bacterium]|nr:hypothetical protein [Candidatus Binatia bacterium]
MNKLIPVLGILALVCATTGCSSRREVRSSTTETIQAAPVEPVVVEKKRTSTQTETRTSY